MCAVWNPRRLFSADRVFAPERLRRHVRWRMAAIVVVALVSLVVGVANGDGKLISLGVICLVGIPHTMFFYRWQTSLDERLARKRSGRG
jgi:hypothetical protein